MTAIAVVGMGCRFAGAPDLPSFWKLVQQGRDAFGPVPADRWDPEVFHSTSGRDMDRHTAPAGAFMPDIRSFPALALGIPPRRVQVMDPQQRFTIETAIEAVEDAGYRPRDLPRATGVYVGLTATEYRVLSASRIIATMMASGALGTPPEDPGVFADAVDHVLPPRPFTAPGVLGNMSAASVAQELDLHGPAYTTDAACASALVALADAVSQLRSGAVDAALAGGAYLQITPEHFIAFSRIGAMSTEGVCRPFDHRADGFVQGDGVGMVLLKRLDDALAAGDRIYAVLHGISINNDGRGDGPMAPVLSGQVEAIRSAWKDAGLDPALATQVETHGTGTTVGDACEIRGLAKVFSGAASVALGSSKANVGHTMSAAGIAGFIKSVMSVHHAEIPPLAGFEAPKEGLDLDAGPLLLPTEPIPWTDPSRLMGISSFGFGGTNGHAVIGAGPEPEVAPEQLELVLLSAAPGALPDLARRTAETVRADVRITVGGVARAWARRRPMAERAGIVASTREQLLAALDALGDGSETPRGTHHATPDGTPKIAFLYPGQGAQRVGMLRDLQRRFPRVSAELQRLEGLLEDELTVPLTQLLYPETRATPVDEALAAEQVTATENCQPIMLATSLALTSLLSQLGVHPHVTTGHSLGEFTAAAAAGLITRADAARLVARRGAAMAALTGEHGAMAAVMAERDVVEGLLVPGSVLANANHPRQHVVSGTQEAVAQVVARAEAIEVRAKALSVSHAFHSPLLDGLDAEDFIGGTAFLKPEVPVVSAITGAPLGADARSVFLRHATSPVVFTDALTGCRDAGADLYLQVGAGGPLASFARGTLRGDHRGVLTLASLEDDDGGFSLLDTLAFLWTSGVDLEVDSICGAKAPATVPPSVLPRESYWAISHKPTRRLKLEGASAARHRALPEAPEAAPEPIAASDADPVLEGVLAVVSKVSAYPRRALKTSMKLVEDLGFDSLMVGDLATKLAEAFPAIGGIPQELLLNGPTVQDLVDLVNNGGAVADEVDDDAPLLRWRPTWTPTPLPQLPHRTLRSGPIVVTGNDVNDARVIAKALEGAGLEVLCSRIDEVPADTATLIWVGAGGRPHPLVHLYNGHLPWHDQAALLLSTLARLEGTRPDVVTLSRIDDPFAAGLAGALRSLAREWPDALVKHLSAEHPLDAAGFVAAELTSADRTVDVRYAPERQVLSLQPDTSPTDTRPPPGVGDIVLITGGTRGIGLSLGLRLASLGAEILLLGRRAPEPEAQAQISAFPNVSARQGDVTDRASLKAALGGAAVTHLIHAAGVLADGPVGTVDASAGARARTVKVTGWLNAVDLTEDTLKVAVGIGSWAGRLGNRHQTHYAAANAMLEALCQHSPPGLDAMVTAFGPWSDSEMVQSIPAPVLAAMRAEGVDFVGPEAGLDALMADLTRATGPSIVGRRLPSSTRRLRVQVPLSVAADPYLLDHAIEGVPVLPLAVATDLMAWTADLPAPLAVTEVTLFRGITVSEPVTAIVSVAADRAEIRVDGALCYTARVSAGAHGESPEAPTAGAAPELSLADFYGNHTFHGPLLQGITHLDGVGDDFVRGVVRTALPSRWTPSTTRAAYTVDPLALDSAMQLAAYVAWVRYQRAGTPVSIGRVDLHQAFKADTAYAADVHFGEAVEDRFTATIVLRDATGAPVLTVTDVVAELRAVEQVDDEPEWTAPADATDPSLWPEVADLQLRLDGVEAMGLSNPYFHVHEGTARNVTTVAGRELVNFSSYNYLGLSGDPAVLAEVHTAVDRYGTSVSASRVASGERPFHGELEALLAESQRAEDALLFTAGHATNVTTVGHLMGPEDLILHDEYIHDSVLQGIKLSGAARRSFRHDDPVHLAEQLEQLRPHYRRCLIIVEGVYSMDGDICQLPAFVELKKQHSCLLMVDEAHSFGVVGATGCGVAEHFDVGPKDVDIWMGTLSKSLASCGGWISGSKVLVNYLRYTAPGFVYSAGLTPANGVAALASLRKMLAEPERVQTLQGNALFFHEQLVSRGLDTGPAVGGSAVVPVVTGNSLHALVLSKRLLDAGINVQPIVYPAVPDDASRLRHFLSSTHTREQLQFTAETIARLLAEIREEFPII